MSVVETVVPVLEARQVFKRYGQVVALAGADFDLRPNEILAVIGDNGAGKSTLIKALSGAVIPDEGDIFLNGVPMHFHAPLDARRQGIETVYQDLALAPALNIAENLFLGRELRRRGVLGLVFRMADRQRMIRESRKWRRFLAVSVRASPWRAQLLSRAES